MAVGTKTTEFTEQTAMADTDEFLTNINGGSSRIPKSAIPELAHDIVFLSGDDILQLTREDHFQKFINMNNTDGDVTVILPDLADVPEFGLFCVLGGTTGQNDLIVQCEVTDQLRARGPFPEGAVSADTVYLGAKRSMGDECIARVYRRGGLWTLDCNTGVRATSDGDNFTVSGAQINKTLATDATGTRQITDADHEEPIWLTTDGSTTLTFQTDIATGVRTTVINGGTGGASFSFGSHTQVGDSTIAIGQAASVIVGPTTSGDSKSIFVAASS